MQQIAAALLNAGGGEAQSGRLSGRGELGKSYNRFVAGRERNKHLRHVQRNLETYDIKKLEEHLDPQKGNIMMSWVAQDFCTVRCNQC